MAFIAKNSTIVTHYRNIEKIVCIGSGKQHFFFLKTKKWNDAKYMVGDFCK